MINIIYGIVGNKQLEETLNDFENIQFEDSFESLINLCEIMGGEISHIIVNMLLDTEGEKLINLCQIADQEGIKVIMLLEEPKSFEKKKFINLLVNFGVHSFIPLEDVSFERIKQEVENYPSEYDFSQFEEEKEGTVEIIETVKSMFKRTLVVWSPFSDGASTISSHLTHVLGLNNFRVGILDFDFLRPKQHKVFEMNFEYSMSDLLDTAARGNLQINNFRNYGKESKYNRKVDVFKSITDYERIYEAQEEDLKVIVDVAKHNYDFLIIDVHSCFDLMPTNLALELATDVLIPVKGDKEGTLEVKRLIEYLDKTQDFDTDKFKLIINKYEGSDLTSLELSAKHDKPILGYISRDKAYENQNNVFKDKKLMNEYVEILKNLDIEAKSQKTGFLTGFFRKKKGGE